MKIIVADDELLQLNKLERCVSKVVPDAEILRFNDPRELQDLIEKGELSDVDIAFLDIEMGSVTGIQISKKLQSLNPNVNIIFVTGYLDYAPQAFSLRASGYVSKPVTENKIRTEMANLRYDTTKPDGDKVLKVRCFGSFEVEAAGEPLRFKREKTKELFAYLIDRRGSVCTPRELCAVLWEDDKFDYLRQLTKDLRETLHAVNAEDAFVSCFKRYHVVTTMIDCDYYDFIDNEPNAIKAFNGEYMSQYSWAEETLAGLIGKSKLHITN